MAALKENAKIHQELKRKTKKEESSDSEDSASEQQKVCYTIYEISAKVLI